MKKTIAWILLFSLVGIPSAFCQSGKGPVEVFRAMHKMPNSIARRVVSNLPSVPTAARKADIKMMTKTYYPDLPSEGRYLRLPKTPSTDTDHARHTKNREYRPFPVTPTEPSKPTSKPTQPDTKPVSDAVQSKGPYGESVVAYFHRLGKANGFPSQVPHWADPYEEGYTHALRFQRRDPSNGFSNFPSSFQRQLRREANAPTVFLPPLARQEFDRTVAAAGEIAARGQERPRRSFNENRTAVVISGKWNLRMTPLAEAQQYPEFNINNFLDYRAYETPFNPQVHHLEVLVATDQPGFAAYLSEARDPRVHITAVSNGNEAIDELSVNPDKYHIVLTDMTMANGNGMDIAKYVHEHHLPCYVTVVSKSSVDPGALFLFGFDGAMSVMSSPEGESFRPASTIFAYLSNMVFNEENVFGLSN